MNLISQLFFGGKYVLKNYRAQLGKCPMGKKEMFLTENWSQFSPIFSRLAPTIR